MPLSKVPAEGLGTGTVLQVVSFSTNSETGTSSSSFVSTPITLSITPKSASSKIFVLVSTTTQMNSGNQPQATIYRNSTNIAGGSIPALFYGFSASSTSWISVNMSYLDSPATTASTTYTVYIKSASGTITVGNSGLSSTITLMEIAA